MSPHTKIIDYHSTSSKTQDVPDKKKETNK